MPPAAPAPSGPQGGCAPPQATAGWPAYSLAQETYRDEKAFDRQRARRRRRAGVLRAIATVVLVPVVLVLVFIGSYVLTCIINGASPEDIAGLLAGLWERVQGWFTGASLFG